MQYTKNYHLPQWVKEDRIMMDDFNQMCQDMETGLTGNRSAAQQDDAALSARIDAAAAKADAAQTAAEALPYRVGTYTGNASGSWLSVYVGFRPSFLLITAQVPSGQSGNGFYRFAAVGAHTTEGVVRLTSSGFQVRWDDSTPYPGVNLSGGVYDYIAFK